MHVSIIIPTYNYACYIGQAIQSVLQQDYPQQHVEVIVIDDGGADDTATVLKPFIDAGCIQYHYQSNAGKAAATMKGISLAKGEIIFTLDADDWFLPGKISKTVALYQQYPKLVHVAGPALIIQPNTPDITESIPTLFLGKPVRGAELAAYFMQQNMLYGGGSTFSARKSALQQVPLTTGVDMYTDEWLVLGILMQGGDSFLMSEALSVWRVHSSNYSTTTQDQTLQNKFYRLQKSSEAVLKILKENCYPRWLIKAYSLKHAVRCMDWKERLNHKSLFGIMQFGLKIILMGGHSFSMLKKHNALNRLAPVWLLKTLKGR